MPNESAVILLVGHGSVSAKKTVIDIGKYKEGHEKFNNDHPNTTWYYITIPDNCNIVLGACRDLDYSF
jgi:hypothetical protein